MIDRILSMQHPFLDDTDYNQTGLGYKRNWCAAELFAVQSKDKEGEYDTLKRTNTSSTKELVHPQKNQHRCTSTSAPIAAEKQYSHNSSFYLTHMWQEYLRTKCLVYDLQLGLQARGCRTFRHRGGSL